MSSLSISSTSTLPSQNCSSLLPLLFLVTTEILISKRLQSQSSTACSSLFLTYSEHCAEFMKTCLTWQCAWFLLQWVLPPFLWLILPFVLWIVARRPHFLRPFLSHLKTASLRSQGTSSWTLLSSFLQLSRYSSGLVSATKTNTSLSLIRGGRGSPFQAFHWAPSSAANGSGCSRSRQLDLGLFGNYGSYWEICGCTPDCS